MSRLSAHPQQERSPRRGPRRLAFVTSTPLSVRGGSGTYVAIRQLLRSLEERGLQIQLHASGEGLLAYTARRLLFNLRVAPRLRAGGYDWVVGFDLDGFHYGRAPAAPYVACIKGVIADELRNERGLVRALLRLQAAWERLAVHRAAVVVATSRYSRDRIVEAYTIPAGKVVIVPEPIDLQAWRADPPGEASDFEEPPAILTVAHMYPRKNLAVLLQAYAQLRDAGIPFQGWIVGEGPCRVGWERLRDGLDLQHRVRFLGTIPRRELVARYRRAALFCLPSRQEGFGIVFVEAMASGVPVVAARAAAVPETVLDGETGLLVDPENPQELARTLAALLADGPRRRALGMAGRRRAEQFQADRVAAAFLTSVQAALEGPPAGRAEGPALADLAGTPSGPSPAPPRDGGAG